MLKRTPFKRKPSSLKKSGSLRAKTKSQEEKDKNKENVEKMHKFFLEIWKERPHRCTNCNTPLYEPVSSGFFDHILEKGNPRWEHLKYEKDNICILCLDCHSNKGIIPKLLELKEQKIKQYS